MIEIEEIEKLLNDDEQKIYYVMGLQNSSAAKPSIKEYKNLKEFACLIVSSISNIENYIFKDEQEAKQYLEFGNLTSKEELSLPSFEKFKKEEYGISFIGKSTRCRYTFYYNNELDEICLYDNDCKEYTYTNFKKATPENYFEMCKEVRKLFLGE